jgi:hypothetical protein
MSLQVWQGLGHVGIHDGLPCLQQEHFRPRAGGTTACLFPAATLQERCEVGGVSSDSKNHGQKQTEAARTIVERADLLINALPDDEGLLALKEKLKQAQAVARLLSLPDNEDL